MGTLSNLIILLGDLGQNSTLKCSACQLFWVWMKKISRKFITTYGTIIHAVLKQTWRPPYFHEMWYQFLENVKVKPYIMKANMNYIFLNQTLSFWGCCNVYYLLLADFMSCKIKLFYVRRILVLFEVSSK